MASNKGSRAPLATVLGRVEGKSGLWLFFLCFVLLWRPSLLSLLTIRKQSMKKWCFGCASRGPRF